MSSLGNLPPQPPRRRALPSRPAHRSYRYGSTAKAGEALMCYASSPSWYWRRPMKIGTPTSATTPSDSIDWLKAGYGNNPNSGCGCINAGRYRTIQRAGASQQICARLSRDPLQNVISPADSPSAILRGRSPARFSILRLSGSYDPWFFPNRKATPLGASSTSMLINILSFSISTTATFPFGFSQVRVT